MTHPMAITLGFCLFLALGYLMVTDEPREIPQIQKRGECRLPKAGETLASNTHYVATGMYVQNCWITRKVARQ